MARAKPRTIRKVARRPALKVTVKPKARAKPGPKYRVVNYAGNWGVELCAANGKIMARATKYYSSKANAIRAAEAIKKAASKASFEVVG